jgi:hypothetical protein
MTLTSDTTNPSVYPAPVTALLPRARELAADLGELPSRNRLMTEFRIGAPKAKAVLDALQLPDPPTGLDPHRLHLVPTEPDRDGTVRSAPDPDPALIPMPAPAGASAQATGAVDPGTDPASVPLPAPVRPVRSWPVLLLAAPAFVAIWSGWVGLGGLTGFGIVRPLPGIWDGLEINTAITLPIGVETYAAYALRAWLSGRVPPRARRFAKWSAIGSLVLGALGQVAYHLMSAAGMATAPWQITALVACLPVAVLGMGAALAHLLHDEPHHADPATSGRTDGGS